MGKFWIICALMTLPVTTASAVEMSASAKVSHLLLFKDPTTGMEMVFVKGGCYQMGAAGDEDDDAYQEELPAHEVCVDNYYIGRYEVTQGDWKSVMGSSLTTQSTCSGDNCPADNVSWNDAQDFISRLNKKTAGQRYRLPTEAEWEYAARSGGKRELYAGGNDIDSVAWYGENSNRKNRPVGTKAPNGIGLYDMSGNVWEWTNDWYGSDFYKNSPRDNPYGPDTGVDRVVRGGCVTGEAANHRVTRRTAYAPDLRKPSLGFRLFKRP